MNPPQQKPTVLVVDDDPAIRKMLVEALSLEGYPVEAVPGGQEALDSLSTSGPRVVLLDLLMDPVSGRDVMQRLQANPSQRAKHKVILVSALSNLESNRDLQADGRLPKPFTIDQLLNTIDGARS